MLAQGIYPERLKFSLIKPVYKSGDKSSPSDYRPISLLPGFSKIFETVIYKRLFDHFNNNAILNGHQYGFRSEVSMENASYIFFFSSTTLYDFWFAQLFLSIVSSPGPSVSNFPLPCFLDRSSRRPPIFFPGWSIVSTFHVAKYIFSFLFLCTRFGRLLFSCPAFHN